MRSIHLSPVLFLVFVFALTCKAAPTRLPPATTIVSAFKQALTSEEDSAEEATTESPIADSYESTTASSEQLEGSGIQDPIQIKAEDGSQGKSGESSISTVEIGSGEVDKSNDENSEIVSSGAEPSNEESRQTSVSKDQSRDTLELGSGQEGSGDIDSSEEGSGEVSKQSLSKKLSKDQLKRIASDDKLILQEKKDGDGEDSDDDSDVYGDGDSDEEGDNSDYDYDSDDYDDSDDDDSDYDDDSDDSDDEDTDTTATKTKQRDTKIDVEKRVSADAPEKKWPEVDVKKVKKSKKNKKDE